MHLKLAIEHMTIAYNLLFSLNMNDLQISKGAPIISI
jgi:hypothetical protein